MTPKYRDRFWTVAAAGALTTAQSGGELHGYGISEIQDRVKTSIPKKIKILVEKIKIFGKKILVQYQKLKNKNFSKNKNFGEHKNFSKTIKIWSKIKILIKSQNLVKNQNFGKKSKFGQKSNFGKKSKLW